MSFHLSHSTLSLPIIVIQFPWRISISISAMTHIWWVQCIYMTLIDSLITYFGVQVLYVLEPTIRNTYQVLIGLRGTVIPGASSALKNILGSAELEIRSRRYTDRPRESGRKIAALRSQRPLPPLSFWRLISVAPPCSLPVAPPLSYP